MPRNQKGSTPRKGSVQVQVFSRPKSTMVVYGNDLATGPLNQATGPPQSGAGVGIGILVGDREYIARK